MKRMLVLLALLIYGLVLGLMIGLLLSSEQRLMLSRKIAAACAEMEQNMPEG